MEKNENDKQDVEALSGPQQGIFNPTNLFNASVDAFGRLRTVDPYTLFDSFHRYRENTKFSTATSGSGSISYRTSESAIHMTIGTSSGSYVYRESKYVFPYQPGKSFLNMNSFVFATPKENLRQRVGLFGTQNGVYLEQDGLSTYFVVRNSVNGNTESNRVAQKDWNGHKFDGSAFYQRNLDVTKANIVWFDIEWLGVGDVRCGFMIDGIPVVAHTFHHENIKNTTYMTTAALPLRYEIENTATTSSISTSIQICSTVISEGGYQAKSQQSWTFTGIQAQEAKTLATPGTFYPLVSIRLKSDRLDAVVLPDQIDILCTTNDNYIYKLVLNPGLTGTSSWVAYDTYSSVEVDKSATGISTTQPGTILASGIGYLKTGDDIKGLENFNYQLGRTIQGTSDIITLCAAASGENAKVHSAIGWYELV